MSAVDGTVGPWSLLAPIRTRMRAVVALSVLSSVATVASLVGIIDIAMTYPEAPVHRTWLAVVVIVVAATVRMAADGAAGMLSHRADNDLQLHLRRRLVAHIRKLPLGWLDARRSSGIIGSVEKDVAAVHQLMGHTVGETVVAVLVPLLSLIALVAVDWRIAAVAVVPVLVTFALMGVMISRGAGLQRDYERASEKVTAAVIELVRGIPVMKSFGRASQGAGRYDAAASSFVRAWSAWSRQSNIYLGLIDVVTSPITVLAVVCGAGLALRDTAGGKPEGLVAGLVLGLGLSAAIVRVAMNSEPIIAGIAALKSIAEVLGTPPITESAEPVPVHGGALEVRNLVFSYGDGPRILDGMSATFESGAPHGSGWVLRFRKVHLRPAVGAFPRPCRRLGAAGRRRSSRHRRARRAPFGVGGVSGSAVAHAALAGEHPAGQERRHRRRNHGGREAREPRYGHRGAAEGPGFGGQRRRNLFRW